MEILRECKKLLFYGGLGTEQYVHIGRKRIPRTMIRATIIFFQLLLAGLTFIVSIKSFFKRGLAETLFPLQCSLLGSIKCSVYCVLLWKTNEIAQLIDYVQMVVQRRMFFWLFICIDRMEACIRRFFCFHFQL